MDCVVCGKSAGCVDNHHCSPAVENRIEGRNRYEFELHGDRQPDFAERLGNGFWLMRMSEEDVR